ncbi:MAG: hypothetical protein IK092_02675, partial [Muribaculaceae bacterium]|nr:hypothetical protein [Muribaculaceae bacterium]
MNKRKTNHIIVVCLLILSAFLIAFCLPHRSKFDLEFKQGSPWQHEELISSFNFMVTPSHNDTVRVTDSVDRVFVPYYRPSLEVKDTMLRALDKELQWVQKKRTLEIETSDILTILNKVRGMYDKGIIDDDTYERISNGSLTKINLGDGKTFNESPTADIISPSKAAA